MSMWTAGRVNVRLRSWSAVLSLQILYLFVDELSVGRGVVVGRVDFLSRFIFRKLPIDYVVREINP